MGRSPPCARGWKHPYCQRRIVWGREAVYANFITSSLICYSKLKSLCFLKSSQIIYSLSKKVYKINNLLWSIFESFSYVQFSSVAQSCPTLGDPRTSTPGLPVHHQLPESTQTHVHRVGDAIQPSHPLSSPSPPALNLSQHQGLF